MHNSSFQNSLCGVLTAVGVSVGGAALSSSFFGCSQKEVTKSDRREEFNQLVSNLKSIGLHVREAEFHGPEIVLYFTDIHNSDDVSVTKRNIARVRELFPFEIIGLEGAWGDLQQAPNNSDYESKIKAIIDANPEHLMSGDEAKSHGFTFKPFTPYYGHYNEFISLPGLQAVGLESKDIDEVDIGTVASINEFYGQLIEALTATKADDQRMFLGEFGYAYIYALDGRYLPVPHAFNNTQNYLKKKYPDFPTFDFSTAYIMRFDNQSLDIGIITNAQYDLVLGTSMKVHEWINDHFVFNRNKISADRIIEEMKQRQVIRAAMVYGLGHSFSGGKGYPSIQEQLASQNVSYIVIDPYKLKLQKGLSDSIEVIIEKETKSTEGK